MIGQRLPDLFAGVFPDAELDENDIAAYGVDSIGEVIRLVSDEVDTSGDGPVVLINGRPVNGLNDVSDLPPEAASRIQVLPSVVAARLGQSPTRPVINIVVKPDLRQLATRAEAGWATRGDAFRGEAELNLLKLDNSNRRSLVLKAQHSDPLLESQRGIRSDPANRYALAGNVVGFGGNEIDPQLSALAGRQVDIIGIPAGVATPTLLQFGANAGSVNATDVGAYRSLVNDLDIYSVNGNVTQNIGTSRFVFTAQLQRSLSQELHGLPTALIRVPAGSAFSPFSQDVSVAYLANNPLKGRHRGTNIDVGATLNSQLWGFDLNASASFVHAVTRSRTDRDFDIALLQASVTAGTTNPFSGLPSDLLGAVRQDFSRSSSDLAQAQVNLNRAVFPLPAGDAHLSLNLAGRLDRITSELTGTTSVLRELKRDDFSARANLQLPIASRTSAIGELTADINGKIGDVTAAGTIYAYGGNLSWRPTQAVNIRLSYSDEDVPAFPGSLNDPIIVNENVRVFDFLREETVLVRYVTGGNPNLATQKKKTVTLEGTVRPFGVPDFSVNAAYVRSANRNLVSGLPPASAEVQAAFPDRYLRDGEGRLVQVDARPVSFARADQEQIRWGLNWRKTFGGSTVIGEDDIAAPARPSAGRGVRLLGSATHSWILDSTRQAELTLPEVDLLNGGAVGYGGGIVRHAVDLNAGVTTRGLGLQLTGQWRGPSSVITGTAAAPDRLTFEGRAMLNARLFANLGPLLPEHEWARGMRVAVQFTNLFDSKQRVVDGSGNTPQRYQPFLIDPLGRSFSLSVRKVF